MGSRGTEATRKLPHRGVRPRGPVAGVQRGRRPLLLRAGAVPVVEGQEGSGTEGREAMVLLCAAPSPPAEGDVLTSRVVSFPLAPPSLPSSPPLPSPRPLRETGRARCGQGRRGPGRAHLFTAQCYWSYGTLGRNPAPHLALCVCRGRGSRRVPRLSRGVLPVLALVLAGPCCLCPIQASSLARCCRGGSEAASGPETLSCSPPQIKCGGAAPCPIREAPRESLGPVGGGQRGGLLGGNLALRRGRGGELWALGLQV